MIKGIAIVKSTAKKSSCNSFGNSKIYILANTTKVTNVIKLKQAIISNDDSTRLALYA